MFENLEAAFADAGVFTSEGGARMPIGSHVVVVESCEVRVGEDARPKYADASLNVKVKNESGEVAFGDWEVSPLTNKQGEVSEGKVRFLKTILTNLGYDKPLSQLPVNAGGLVGSRVRVDVSEELSKKMNPDTNEPYRNRRLFVTELIERAGAAPKTVEYVPAAVVADDSDDIW